MQKALYHYIKLVKTIGHVLENDTYDYSSIFASTGSLQGLLKTIKKGGNLTAITNPPKFLLPLTILSDYRKDNAPLIFQLGEWYLIITPNKTELFIAKKGDTQVRIIVSIADNWFFKNSEYRFDLSLDNSIAYLAIKNKHLLLTVVDSCGAGSGEGYESVFHMDKHGRLQHLTCYDYRNRELFQEKRENRHFRGTTQFKQLIALKQSACKGKEDIHYYIPPL